MGNDTRKDIIKKLKKDPTYINQIENEDEELLLYAIHFGYKYTDDLLDRFCKNDLYVKFYIEKDKDFIRYFMNSKHFNVDRFKNEEIIRKKIIEYAIENDLYNNPIIMCWMELSGNIDLFNKIGIYFIGKDMLNNNDFNFSNNIKELYLIDGDVDTINTLIDKVKKYNINVEYINVKLKRSAYNDLEINSIKDKSIIKFYTTSYKKISIEEIKEMNKLLDLCVSDIKLSKLSPYEKYIAVYNIVKSFKEYRIYKDDDFKDFIDNDESRSIYLVLNNLYIVCDGFSKLLETLLDRVGISNISFGSIKLNHALNYVNIVDEKYNIDGFYISDVTNDNELDFMMDKKYENIHILTKDNKVKRIGEENVDYIFDMNIEEIYNYIKYSVNYEKVMCFLSKMDNNFYNKIKGSNININLATSIYNYLNNKVDKSINGEKDIKAILEVKQFILNKKYTDDEYEVEKNKLIKLNPNILKNIDIEKVCNKLKGISIKEIKKYMSILNEEEFNILETALIKINFEYISNEEDMYFLLDLYENDIFFKISLDKDLDEIEINKIISKLKVLGYEVTYIVDDMIIFIFSLNEEYYDKTIVGVYNELNNIKNGFMGVYEENKGFTK